MSLTDSSRTGGGASKAGLLMEDIMNGKSLLRPQALAVAVALALAAGCAGQRPVFYPNEKLQTVTNEQVERDIDECIVLAEQSGAGSRRASKVAGRTATASAVGAAGGAAAGAVRGHAGRGAAAGAAAGAAGGFVASMIRTRDLDPVTKRWVEACLGERGYRTIGWR